MAERRTTQVAQKGSSGDRLLAALALFTVERPEWTVDAAAAALGVSATTTYRYFKSLVKSGLISPVAGASYMLGPAIVQMDRQIQICDPMLIAARGVMVDLIQHASDGATALLCRLFHDRVMCMHQVVGRGPQGPVSYERGRPMPLFRGATSKIILAHLPTRTLKSIFAHDADVVAAAGLGRTWEEFRTALALLRRNGACISYGEIDPGRIGIAAPIFDAQRSILGSLTIVLPAVRGEEGLVDRLIPLVIAGAREVERAMSHKTSAMPSPARVKIAR
ncbi:MAG TPA: IclR family transcriptional regulator C-terminal domain-containing protein [Xanthobacteraceae bacterium]|jgi:DNA-binding IclR family transcriptional regulator|nr:IclR family transcriptional regulator C-terminal domain-containing protein [Xanthobacteraceae bacterium]